MEMSLIAGNDVIRFMGIDRAGFPKLDRFG